MSLVKQELNPYGIYAGIPARYIKERLKEMLDKMARMKINEVSENGG